MRQLTPLRTSRMKLNITLRNSTVFAQFNRVARPPRIPGIARFELKEPYSRERVQLALRGWLIKQLESASWQDLQDLTIVTAGGTPIQLSSLAFAIIGWTMREVPEITGFKHDDGHCIIQYDRDFIPRVILERRWSTPQLSHKFPAKDVRLRGKLPWRKK